MYTITIRNDSHIPELQREVCGGDFIVTIKAPNGDGLIFSAPTFQDGMDEAGKLIQWHISN